MKIQYMLSVLVLASDVAVANVLSDTAAYDVSVIDDTVSIDWLRADVVPVHKQSFMFDTAFDLSLKTDVAQYFTLSASHNVHMDKYFRHHDRPPITHHMPEHVPAVPVPAAVWLFGSGLMTLVAIARRRNTV